MKYVLSFLLLLVTNNAYAKLYPVEGSYPVLNFAYYNTPCGDTDCLVKGEVGTVTGKTFNFQAYLDRDHLGIWRGDGQIIVAYGNTKTGQKYFRCEYPIRLAIEEFEDGVARVRVQLAQQIPVLQDHCDQSSIYTQISRDWGPMMFRAR